MVRNIITPFLSGFGVTLLVLVTLYPIIALLADLLGASSFQVGIGSIDVYRFVRDGQSASTTLLPFGLLVLSLLGGLLNTGLRSLINTFGK